MNNVQLFDHWATTYHQFVTSTQDNFPFAGYDAMNDLVFSLVQPGYIDVLDLGIGTGTLATRISHYPGTRIYGLDFSAKMLAKCAEKIPGAILQQQDFARDISLPAGWPIFDYIISNYTFHHFDEQGKLERILFLLGKLKTRGN